MIFSRILFLSTVLPVLLSGFYGDSSSAGELSPGVSYFFSIPRPNGATIILTVDNKTGFHNGVEGKHTPYRVILDYLINGGSLSIRVHILNGDMTNQRILINLAVDEQYYIYHPLLGLNAVSRIQMEKQLMRAGFNLNDLITVLDPLRGTDKQEWKSETDNEGFIVLSAPNKLACRDEYHFSSFRVLPDMVWLCQNSQQKKMQIELSGTTKLYSYVLPARVIYKKNKEVTSEIQIQATELSTWQDMASYSKENLSKTLHPSNALSLNQL